MNYTNQQLQLALAKMLPEKISVTPFGILDWKDEDWTIQDTEWLHVCWLVEQTLDGAQKYLYGDILGELVGIEEDYYDGITYSESQKLIYSSWQQRAEALRKVKGIEI